MVDSLLLRYLGLPVGNARHRDTIITHLIADDDFSKPLDEFCHNFGVFPLVCEPGGGALCQHFLGQLFYLFERSATIVGGGHCCQKSMHVLSQPIASGCLLGVSINRCSSDVLLEPIQLGYKFLDLLLDIFELLRVTVSVVRNGHSLDQYLVMLDERVHAAKGGLEGREPIGGLFRDIQEYLHAIGDSLLLCYEDPNSQRAGFAEAAGTLTSTCIDVIRRGPGICCRSLPEHGFASRSVCERGWEREWFGAQDTSPVESGPSGSAVPPPFQLLRPCSSRELSTTL